MARPGKRRRIRKWLFVNTLFADPKVQSLTTVLSAILFAGLVFSGFLLFRSYDSADLVQRGKRYMSEGKMASAAQTFQLLVNRHRNHYEGHLLLGETYLELGDRRRAEREFQIAASLKSNGSVGNTAASIAMSKLSVSRKQFDVAEKQLVAAYRKSPGDPDIQNALFDTYSLWGETLLEENQDYLGAIQKYERALRFATDYTLEDRLKDQLVEAVQTYSKVLIQQQDFESAIMLLKKSLRYRYQPNTLIQVAELYERLKRLDDAIVWYRKAFDANPAIISLKLSNMLMQKGRELVDAKQPEVAEKYFQEARQISEMANVPQELLYPVSVNNVQLQVKDFDVDTGEFLPVAQLTLQNRGVRPLNFLTLKAAFYAGEHQVGELVQTVVSPEAPLSAEGQPKNSKNLALKPSRRMNLHMLEGQPLRVKISVAYSEDQNPEWYTKAIHEASLAGFRKRDEALNPAENPTPPTTAGGGNSTAPVTPTVPAPAAPGTAPL